MCVPSRNRFFDAIKSAAVPRSKYPWGALRLSPCLCVLRWRLLVCSCNLNCHCEPVRTLTSENCKHFCNHPTSRFAKRRLFFECQRFRRTWSSTQESGGSSACNRKARCKKVVLGFPAEPCKANTTGTPSDEPKSRKMHQCELVERYVRLPSFPRIKARFQRAALEPFGVSFSSIFLHEKKDGATGGRRTCREVGKHVKQKIPPKAPEVP